MGRRLPASGVILDVGGGSGVYALPFAMEGYEVHLIDPIDLSTSMFAHYVEELLDDLGRRQDVDDLTVARLKWAYLPLRRHEK